MTFFESTALPSDRNFSGPGARAHHRDRRTASALALPSPATRSGSVLIAGLLLTLGVILALPTPSLAGGRGEVEKIRVVRDVDVEIWTNKGPGARYCVGEEIEIYFRTNRDAWVAVIDFDTRGSAHRIFPNRFDREHFVRGGKTYRLPVDGYSLEVEGPPGREVVTAIASTDRRELRRAVDHLIDSSRYLPTSGPWGKGRSGKAYADSGDWDDDRYDDDRDYYEHRDYEKIVVTGEDEVAFDSISHRVRDGRSCRRHERPRHRPWWYR
jgi:hypothetical protein